LEEYSSLREIEHVNDLEELHEATSRLYVSTHPVQYAVDQ